MYSHFSIYDSKVKKNCYFHLNVKYYKLKCRHILHKILIITFVTLTSYFFDMLKFSSSSSTFFGVLFFASLAIIFFLNSDNITFSKFTLFYSRKNNFLQYRFFICIIKSHKHFTTTLI